MSLTRKVAFNTVVQIIGKGTTTVISLFLVAALTRYLGVAGYGEYTTIFAYLAFFGVLADFGFFWILVREIAKPDVDVNKAVSNILTLRTVVGVVIFGLGYLISFFIPQYSSIQSGIGIAAFSMLFLALNSTYVGVFQNKLRMDKATITDVVGRIIILIFTLFLIKQGYGLTMILWAYAIGNIVNLLLSAWLGRAYVKFRPAFDWAYWKQVIVQAWPMAVVLVLNLIYFRIDTLMLSLLKTSTDVGIYGPPYKVLEMILLLPSMFMGNIFPIMSRYIHTGDDRLRTTLQKSFDFLLMLALPVAILIIYAAEPIIRIVAGQDFVVAQTVPPVFGLASTSVLALQILIIAVCFSFLSIIFNYLVIALGKQAKLIWPNLIFVIFNLGLNWLLIPHFSYIGAALVTVLTEAIVLIFTWRIAYANMSTRLNFQILWKALLAGLVMGLFLIFIGSGVNWVLMCALACMIYVLILWFSRAINKDMFLVLFKRGE
ncbi:MAG: flippase [Candidatus Berkelbacteria bacterium]